MLSKEQKSVIRNTVKKSVNLIDELLIKEAIPDKGWSDTLLSQFMESLASSDSNNRKDVVGAGEREGRVISNFVSKLHFGMSHGIGRSGNIAETQPKALGSSIINSISNNFALQTIQLVGLKHCKKPIVLPVCTGMALTLSLLTLKQKKPSATHVIWSRIDQKSCFKSIVAAGLIPVVVELKVFENPENSSFEFGLTTECLENAISELNPEQILCIITTTSCFAPRRPDDVVMTSTIAKKYGLFHLVNNAYGLQSKLIVKNLDEALMLNGVDLFVQSTDKNFLTPVGGSIVASSNKQFVADVGKLYPGRASGIPCRDFVLTMLSVGKDGYLKLIEDRYQVEEYLLEKITELADEFNEVAWQPDGNDISIAMTLKSLKTPEKQKLFGGILYSKLKVTGARVVASTSATTLISGFKFINFNSHSNYQHCGYLVIAGAIGMKMEEVDELISRIRLGLNEIKCN